MKTIVSRRQRHPRWEVKGMFLKCVALLALLAFFHFSSGNMGIFQECQRMPLAPLLQPKGNKAWHSSPSMQETARESRPTRRFFRLFANLSSAGVRSRLQLRFDPALRLDDRSRDFARDEQKGEDEGVDE